MRSRSPRELLAYVGASIGTGEWLTVDQAMISAFAAATGDHQWIHVDAARVARELPGGKTIAHGFLTLSLLPLLAHSIIAIKGKARTINYGANKFALSHRYPADRGYAFTLR